MPRSVSSIALRVLASLAALYVLLVVVVYAAQRKLYYPADTQPHTAAELDLSGVRDVIIDTPDGEKLRALYLPPAAPGRAVVLYCHGNRGRLPDRAHRIGLLGQEGNGVLFLSYRGYSGSTGEPSQQGLLTDARAAYDWLAREAPGRRIVLYGESLGTGIAVEIATERPAAGVVLDAPYTTLAEALKSHAPWLPVLTLVKDRYPTVDWIQSLRAPLLVLHGDDDASIPTAQAQRVFQLAREPKRFVAISGGAHGDCLERATADVLQFLRSVE